MTLILCCFFSSEMLLSFQDVMEYISYKMFQIDSPQNIVPEIFVVMEIYCSWAWTSSMAAILLSSLTYELLTLIRGICHFLCFK